jgi:hypothetical protein
MLSCCKFLHGAAEVALLEAAGAAAFEVGFVFSKAGIRGSFNSLVPKIGHRSKIITRSATEPPKRFGGCTLFEANALEFTLGLDLSEMCCFC